MDLQTTWFLLVGVLLAGYAILDGFDLGVGVLHFLVGKSDRERRVLLNSVGPVWDGNEVWLLTGGGAIFAAFPAVYATVFSSFYLALMLVLLGLVFRAVSLEFRSKIESPRWRFAWDLAFSLGSFLPALLFGVAIGNLVRGLKLGMDGEYAGTFLDLLNPFALLCGLLGLAMFTMQGAAWLLVKTEGDVRARARRAAGVAWTAFLVLWLATTLASRAAAPLFWKPYANPLAWLAPAAFLAAMLLFPASVKAGRYGRAFLASSLAIAGLLATFGIGLYPNMVPARDAALALTIHNASSTALTLKTMLAIALLGMPFVLGYTIYIYRRFRGPVALDELSY